MLLGASPKLMPRAGSSVHTGVPINIDIDITINSNSNSNINRNRYEGAINV